MGKTTVTLSLSDSVVKVLDELPRGDKSAYVEKLILSDRENNKNYITQVKREKDELVIQLRKCNVIIDDYERQQLQILKEKEEEARKEREALQKQRVVEQAAELKKLKGKFSIVDSKLMNSIIKEVKNNPDLVYNDSWLNEKLARVREFARIGSSDLERYLKLLGDIDE